MLRILYGCGWSSGRSRIAESGPALFLSKVFGFGDAVADMIVLRVSRETVCCGGRVYSCGGFNTPLPLEASLRGCVGVVDLTLIRNTA